MSLRAGKVPATLHFTALPEELAQVETGLFVPQQALDWPMAGDPPRMAVSSFGMSGTNVHAVLEQAPGALSRQGDGATVATGPLLFPLSATSAAALRDTARRVADWVNSSGGELAPADLAYTLACRRGHRPVRTAVIADNASGLLTGLREIVDSDAQYPAAVGHDERGPVWVFSGQGSQWAAMGVGLLETEPVFAATRSPRSSR